MTNQLILELGILGSLISFLSNIPYILDALRGKTQPQRTTWGIFVLLNITFVANQAAVGATSSLMLAVGYLLSSLIIFVISIPKGTGGGTLFGLILWYSSGSPLFSVVADLLMATLAYTPTFLKSYTNPLSETAANGYGVGLGH